jgi:hypothetical protein
MTDNNLAEIAAQFAEAIKACTPKVTVTKNGYELRTQILELAQAQLWEDYHAKWGEFELSIIKDSKTSEVVTRGQTPVPPTVEQVLDTARKFYEFVGLTPTTQKQ